MQLVAIIGKEGRLTVTGQASALDVAQLDKLGVDTQLDLALADGKLSITPLPTKHE